MNVIFFNSKVKNDLFSLEKPSSTKSSKQIKLLETFGNKLGMPYSKRISQEIRIFYCFHQNQAVILHAFIKKSQKTPQKEIQTALMRIALLTEQ